MRISDWSSDVCSSDVLDPVVTGGEGQEVRLADAGGGVEIEGGEGLACGQAGLVAMALDAPGGAISHLDLEKRGQQVGGRPAIAIGGVGEETGRAHVGTPVTNDQHV